MQIYTAQQAAEAVQKALADASKAGVFGIVADGEPDIESMGLIDGEPAIGVELSNGQQFFVTVTHA